MLEAIAALGQRRQAAVGAGDSVEMLLEQPSATHVLTFEFGLSQPVYREIQLSEYDPAKAAGYFLTSGPSNGPLGTPTALITDAEKTFRMRIMGWVTKVDKSRSKIRELLPAGQREWLDSFLAECNRSQEAMNADLAKAVESLKGGRNRLLVTCRFRDGAHSQWIGDPALPFRAIYRFLLREEVFGKSSAQGHCSVCGERKDVSGRIASEVFKFATFDKPGFITGGFDQRLIWRNLPVCMDCYVRLKVGREFVEEEMTFRFCGLRYWLVPKFVVDLERSDEALDIIRLWENKQRLDRDMARRIMGEEDEILDILAEQKDFLTLNFVFLERSNAMERILLSVDDVLPSRLRCIFEAKEFVDRVPFLSASKLQYNLRRLSPFFSKTKAGGREEILWTPFLEIIGHILRGQPLDRGTFLAALLGRIRRDVANMRSIHSWDGGIGTWVEWAGDYGQRPVKAGGDDNNGGAHTVDNLWRMPVYAWMNLVFLERLGILDNLRGGERRLEATMLRDDDQVKALERTFTSYPGTFYNEATKAAFLLGSLTQMLLDVQYADRKATPFLKQLKGLRLTAQDLRVLLPKVENKLQEYDKFTLSRRRVAQQVAAYMVQAGHDLATLSPDEVSFYFVLGMNLVHVVWDAVGSQGGADASSPDEGD